MGEGKKSVFAQWQKCTTWVLTWSTTWVMVPPMREVHERFARWLDSRGLSQAQAAELLGCSQVYVSMLRAGSKSAGIRTAFAIESATADWDDGPIDASEWCRPVEADEAVG